MQRAVLVSLAVAFAGVLALDGAEPRVALACSAGSDWDPIADSDVIVEGRITGWTEAGESSAPMFTTVQVYLDLQKTWKGNATTTFVDPTSRLKGPADAWGGGGGACGVFDEDPTGAYVILGLSYSPAGQGQLVSNRLKVLYMGEASEGERYEAALERLASLSSVRPPVTGSGDLLNNNPDSSLNIMLPAAGSIILAAAAVEVLKGRRNT